MSGKERAFSVYPSEDEPEIWVEAKTAEGAQALADQYTSSEGLDPYTLVGLDRNVKLGTEAVNHGRYRMYWHHADAWHFELRYSPSTPVAEALLSDSEGAKP